MARKRLPQPEVLLELQRRGFDVIGSMIEAISFRMDLDEEALKNPVYQSMIAGDYELRPNPLAGAQKPYVMTLRSKLKLETCATMMNFAFPRHKSVETRETIDHGITILVKHFTEPKALPEPKPITIDLPAVPREALPEPELPVFATPAPSLRDASDAPAKPKPFRPR